jgi:hypothetical protein
MHLLPLKDGETTILPTNRQDKGTAKKFMERDETAHREVAQIAMRALLQPALYRATRRAELITYKGKRFLLLASRPFERVSIDAIVNINGDLKSKHIV